MTPWYVKAKELLKARDIKLAQLGDILGVSGSAAGHYLKGRRHPKPGMLKKIAEAAGVSVSELIEDDPSFARDQYEHDVLETLREIPEDRRESALAMLRGLAHPPFNEGLDSE